MKIFKLLIIACFTVFYTYSQTWENYDYEKERQSAYRKKYFASLNVLNMEMSSNDLLRITGEAKIYANPLKRLWIEASYLKTYFSMQKYLAKDCKTCENKYRTHGKAELGIRFSMIDKLILDKEKITHSIQHTSKNIISKYAIYNIPKRRFFAVRAGFYTFNHMISSQWVDQNILSENLTNYRNSGLYSGLSLSGIVNTQIKNVKNTSTSIGYFHDYYLDVMFSTWESAEDFLIKGVAHTVPLNTNNANSFQTGSLGFRFGYSALVIRTKANLSFGVELGYHPGIKNNLTFPIFERRLYAGWKFGMSLSV